MTTENSGVTQDSLPPRVTHDEMGRPMSERAQEVWSQPAGLNHTIPGIPAAQTEEREEVEGMEDILPSGRMPQLSRFVVAHVVGPELMPRQGAASLTLERELADTAVRQAKVRVLMKNCEYRMAQLRIRAEQIAGIRGSESCWRAYNQQLQTWVKLLAADERLAEKALSLRKSMGHEIGEELTPEEDLAKAINGNVDKESAEGDESAEGGKSRKAPALPPPPMARREFRVPAGVRPMALSGVKAASDRKSDEADEGSDS